MVRLNNGVVVILALAQLNVKPGVLIDAMDSGRVGAAFVHARKTRKAQRHARIAFATPELLWKVLTARLAAGVIYCGGD